MSTAATITRLKEVLPSHALRLNEPLSCHTTFEIGGPAEVMVFPETANQIKAVVDLCREEKTPLHVIGLGSDLLIADSGLRGVVMKLAENYSRCSLDGCVLRAESGASNAQIAQLTCEAGLAGYEFASGIPGTVGGAAIMNAGAYDGQLSDVARSVDCLTREGEFLTLSHDQAQWGYRKSLMNDEGYIVLAVELELTPDTSEAIQARIDDLAFRRREKQPLDMPSAGSTFKRPQGYFVGQLVQEAGLRGFRVGGAAVSQKHCGFVVNENKATAADVRALIAEIQKRIFAEAGVSLEPEVRMWGFDDSATAENDIK